MRLKFGLLKGLLKEENIENAFWSSVGIKHLRSCKNKKSAFGIFQKSAFKNKFLIMLISKS